MANTIAETNKSGNGPSISASEASPFFERRIEFHLARKPSYPYSSIAGSDFHLETLNPSSDSHRAAASIARGPSGPAGKISDGGGDFFEHGLDPELRSQITFRRIVSGVFGVFLIGTGFCLFNCMFCFLGFFFLLNFDWFLGFDHDFFFDLVFNFIWILIALS